MYILITWLFAKFNSNLQEKIYIWSEYFFFYIYFSGMPTWIVTVLIFLQLGNVWLSYGLMAIWILSQFLSWNFSVAMAVAK